MRNIFFEKILTEHKKNIIIKNKNNIKNENKNREENESVKKDLTKIMMNPIRLRIVQYLMIHKQGTTGEMKQELSDISPASLYRHVKILLEAGCIEVFEEKKIRGTTEKTYGLVQQPMGEVTEQDIAGLFQSGMLSLMTSFEQYFAGEDADPKRDMMSFSTSTLLLTDEEFMEFFQKMGEVFNGVIGNQPTEGRKQRRITFISSPCEKI